MDQQVRPIDANALKKRAREIYEFITHIGSPYDVERFIDDAPTLDYAPVRHGEWEERTRILSWCDDDVDVYFVFSACNEENYGETPFCPNCGAKMDGGKRECLTSRIEKRLHSETVISWSSV